VLEIHHDDPGFGYRFITDELNAGQTVASRNRVQRICRDQRVWAFHAKKKGLNRRPGPAVHDDRVRRDFSAIRPNELWLADIMEHPTTCIPVVVATLRFVATLVVHRDAPQESPSQVLFSVAY
jgi:transposase InsO family protein